MIEDKLNREERIRLECLAQANAGAQMGRSQPVREILTRASLFEKFVLFGYTRQEDTNA